MARAGRRARQRARALAARRLAQQRQRSARESFERARRRLARREELMRTYGSLWHVFQRLEETSWASPSDVEWSDDDSSCDESRCDEQALSPTAVFHEYFYAAKFKRLVKFLQHTPIGLTLLETKLAAGWSLATSADDFGLTMLHAAAALDDPAIASMLLRYGADPNAGDGENETPLHIAAEAGAHRTLVCLLENGAGADGVHNYGITALQLAAAGNSRECCRALIAAGADVNREDQDGITPLFYAATDQKYPRCIEPLLDAGARGSLDVLRRAVGSGSPRGLHPLLRIPPATDANLGRWWLRDMDEYGLHFRERMRVNLAYLERLDAAGGIFLYERDQQRRLVSLLRRHVAPHAPDDVLHVIVSFWGHPGSY